MMEKKETKYCEPTKRLLKQKLIKTGPIQPSDKKRGFEELPSPCLCSDEEDVKSFVPGQGKQL
jgi:hypothetical protein